MASRPTVSQRSLLRDVALVATCTTAMVVNVRPLPPLSLQYSRPTPLDI